MCFGKLGIPVSVLIESLYRQIIMTNIIPYSLSVPTIPTRDKMTEYATEQLKSTVLHIPKTLLAPDTVNAWAKRLKSEISKLAELPNRFVLVNEEP